MTVINPFDFFVDEYAERFPFRYDPAWRADLAPYLRAGRARRRCVDRVARRRAAGERRDRIIDFLVALNQRLQRDVAYTIRMEPGVQTPEETLRARHRLVPRLGLAAGADPARARPRRPVRVRLPGPARRRTSSRSTGRAARPRTSPTCTPGPRSTSPARAGSGSTRPRDCSPARATSRSRHARTRRAPAPITGARRPVRGRRSTSPTRSRRVHEDPRVTLPYSDAQWSASTRSATRSTPSSPPATCASPWAASRPSSRSTTWRRRSGTSRPTARQARARAELAAPAAASASRPAGSLQHGQGKWYPGRAVAALADRYPLARRRRPLWRDPTCSPTRGRRAAPAAAGGASWRPRSRRARAPPSASACRPRGPPRPPVDEARLPVG